VQHTPPLQAWSGPQQTPPAHSSYAQAQLPAKHAWFGPAQVPVLQVPPQPSAAPQALPAQDGVQHCPATQASPAAQQPVPQVSPVQVHIPETQVCPGPGQEPWHAPPQPSDAPQALPAQDGVQQAPPEQAWPASQQVEPQVVKGQAQTWSRVQYFPPEQVPQERVPPQPSGTAPHVAPRDPQVAGTQAVHTPPWQVWKGPQHAAPQDANAHWHAPLTQALFCPVHAPWQSPPQPSGSPQGRPAHWG